jgi:hypothetical protein
MSTPRERIETELKAALKAKDKERLGTLRMLLSEIKNEQIRSGQEVDEPTFLKLVQKAVKQRHDSAEQYRKGDREELAEKEEREAEILEAYLPAQASENEIRSAIEEFVDAEGLSGPAAIGPVMKAMMSRFSGQADGGTINRIAREVLS